MVVFHCMVGVDYHLKFNPCINMKKNANLGSPVRFAVSGRGQSPASGLSVYVH